MDFEDKSQQFGEAGFAKLQDLVGSEAADALLRSLGADLRLRFAAGMDDPARVAGDAHDMASAAGIVGFARFSASCRALEAACRSGQADTAMLAALREARDRVVAEIDALVGRG